MVALVAELRRYRSLAEHYELCALAYKRISELNDLCEAHPGLSDPIGIAAESELMDVVTRLRQYAHEIRAAIGTTP